MEVWRFLQVEEQDVRGWLTKESIYYDRLAYVIKRDSHNIFFVINTVNHKVIAMENVEEFPYEIAITTSFQSGRSGGNTNCFIRTDNVTVTADTIHVREDISESLVIPNGDKIPYVPKETTVATFTSGTDISWLIEAICVKKKSYPTVIDALFVSEDPCRVVTRRPDWQRGVCDRIHLCDANGSILRSIQSR
jgi:hypothetical protein